MAATTARSRRRRTRTGFGDTPTGTRRVALYLRRSTDDEHQPFSIDAQLAALTSYVNSQPGWIIAGEPFTDDASGATTERPGLQRALRAAAASRYDVLLVYRVDRFSRRLSDLLDLLGQLEDAGVAFTSATEPFDTSTSIGRMLVQLLGVFAEFERETIIDRVINGMNAKAAKGKWPGGNRPYGYLIDRATQKLTPHEHEAAILREIVRMYVKKRLGTRAIADELNRRGITNRTGKKWSGMTIGRLLDNPAYTGDIVYGDTHVPDAHPALIDRPTWDHIREIADSRSDAHNQRAMNGSDYHLTGLITCPRCKNKYIGTSAKGRTRSYHYYTCYSRSRYGAHGCTSPAWTPPPWTKPYSKPCTTSTATPTPSSPTRSTRREPTTATTTPTGTPNSTPSKPPSPPRPQHAKNTGQRSRTAPWTRKTPARDYANSAPRSKPSKSAATRSPT